MPNIKSAKKRVLVSATKQARNKADKTALIIHKNAAARKKSQLAKKLNAVS